jgi:hypothetical protein
MVYYVAYRPPLDLENRRQVEEQLRTLGGRQIRGSFWAISKRDLLAARTVLQKLSPLLLRRTREIRKPDLANEKEQKELGSLIVIAYKATKGMKKEKVRSWLRRAPCLRLSPGVYAFPQRRFFDKTGRLVNAGIFWELIRQFDEGAVIIPRLVVVNTKAVDRLVDEIGRRVVKEAAKIVEGYETLYKKASQDDVNRQHVVEIARRIRRRFVTLKKVAAIYEKWLKLDLGSTVMKPYPAMRKVRLMLEEKYGAPKW